MGEKKKTDPLLQIVKRSRVARTIQEPASTILSLLAVGSQNNKGWCYMPRVTVFEIIDQYRMIRGLTRRELADSAGVSIKRINRYKEITAVDFINICKVINVNIGKFWDIYNLLNEEVACNG